MTSQERARALCAWMEHTMIGVRFREDRIAEIAAAIDAAVGEEREECARVVDGWHVKKGGYGELAWQIRARSGKQADVVRSTLTPEQVSEGLRRGALDAAARPQWQRSADVRDLPDLNEEPGGPVRELEALRVYFEKTGSVLDVVSGLIASPEQRWRKAFDAIVELRESVHAARKPETP